MSMDHRAITHTLNEARRRLLSARHVVGQEGHPPANWIGELSSSALSTATATCALELVYRERQRDDLPALIRGGLAWLAAHQNEDGGWGDTTDSPSNISTTALCWAALGVNQQLAETYRRALDASEKWLRREAGGITPNAVCRAIEVAYGEDRTFSAPILTMCALASRFGRGPAAWRRIPALPFELAACPQKWLRSLGLGVVSYALPALIAIGQVKHYHHPTANPLLRLLRNLTRQRTLEILQLIQPATGGFLEAAPLTSFVVMSLASMRLADHPVVERGTEFLIESVREDGSWLIDTNLATWVTTLSVGALAAADNLEEYLPSEHRTAICNWLLKQQSRVEHPYTHAPSGGWAWTDLAGGVPDADDTAGALLALWHLLRAGERDIVRGGRARRHAAGGSERVSMHYNPDKASVSTVCATARAKAGGSGSTLSRVHPRGELDKEVHHAVTAGIRWLLDVQNRDGGIPTFCRGWGKLPFDRSSPDLTAHALRAVDTWRDYLPDELRHRVDVATNRAIRYLLGLQRGDGSWVPLWFGNQQAPELENPVYGTTRVLLAPSVLALDELVRPSWRDAQQRGARWLMAAQNEDGGWGGAPSATSTIEETALAVEALTARRNTGDGRIAGSVQRGAAWLVEHTKGGTRFPPAPIGLYFAKLWYSERLYPLIFTVAALERVSSVYNCKTGSACHPA